MNCKCLYTDYIDQMIQAHGGEKLPPEDLQQLFVLLGLDRKSSKTTLKKSGVVSTLSQQSTHSSFQGSKNYGSGFLPDINTKIQKSNSFDSAMSNNDNNNEMTEIYANNNNNTNTHNDDFDQQSFESSHNPTSVHSGNNNNPTTNKNNKNSWGHVKQQTEVMISLEQEIRQLCDVLQMDPQALIDEIDSRLVLG